MTLQISDLPIADIVAASLAKMPPIKPRHSEEWYKCKRDFVYFVNTYGVIENPQEGKWIPFKLWPEQEELARIMQAEQKVVLLKARQLGASWLALWFGLWLMIFHSVATIGLYSRRIDESSYLLNERMKAMYNRLPAELRVGGKANMDNSRVWKLANDSSVRAFPTTAGDSYTFSLVIIDEADLIPDLNNVMRMVKASIDNGGRMIMLSRSNKDNPVSPFKSVYRAAKDGANNWRHFFMSWSVHPGRDQAWYDDQKQDIQERTGSLDELWEQYPATDEEALRASILNKRLPLAWLDACYKPIKPIECERPSGLPDRLEIYQPPQSGRQYVLACDPAEGKQTSNDTAISVLDWNSGEEVAVLSGKYDISDTALYISMLSRWYNWAYIMIERNNHGHAVLLAVFDRVRAGLLKPGLILNGHDGKPGWLTNSKGKPLLYGILSEMLQYGQVILHSEKTYSQLASIEKATLSAPSGLPDDRSDSFALAAVAIIYSVREETVVSNFRRRIVDYD